MSDNKEKDPKNLEQEPNTDSDEKTEKSLEEKLAETEDK